MRTVAIPDVEISAVCIVHVHYSFNLFAVYGLRGGEFEEGVKSG